MIVIRIELEHYTEFRHIAQLFHRIIGKRRPDRSVAEHLIGKPAFALRRGGHQVRVRHFYRIAVLLHSRFQQSAIRAFAVFVVIRVH